MAPPYKCVAYPNELGGWSALCLDLDIAVDDRSCAAVQSAMDSALREFLASVEDLPPTDRERLLNRRAPWHVRASWGFRMLRDALTPGEAWHSFNAGGGRGWASANQHV